MSIYKFVALVSIYNEAKASFFFLSAFFVNYSWIKGLIPSLFNFKYLLLFN